MLTRTGILSPRHAPGELGDMAERSPLITGQRVRHRLRRRLGRALAAALRLGGIILLLAGAAAVVAAAVQWLLTSPRFAVAVVEVQGTSRLSPAEVREAAAISPGENLFRLNSEEVVARLRQLGPVKRAEVIRSFPNRVTLVVEERVPFTLAQAGRLYWLDEDGVSLGPEPRAVTPRLPVITGIRPEETRSGGAAAEDARAAVSLIRSMLRTGSSLTREISEIDMSGADGPILYTVDGVEVRLGTADWEDRLGRLEGVLAQIRSLGEPVEYVDLRFRGQVVFKPRLR
ncbi:MAG: cell division protein FtsQ, cell division protein FtsQ [Candidatus Rokubacteria bacterium CSP1-6]|nr:MAG: cell division protein FtsQ, cell division protein FtsQ [Candidatus Rokubacteria bacterium CSP1-6]